MFNQKYRFTYDEVRIIVMALVELKNSLIAEGRYCYELGYLPKYRQNPTRLHIVLKEDLLKCDQYSEQAKLLSRHHISTEEDLSSHQEKVEEKMADTAHHGAEAGSNVGQDFR